MPPHRTARHHSEASSSRHGKGPTRDAALMGPLVATGAGDVAPAATRAPATPLPAAHRRSPRTGPLHAAVSLLSPGMVARLPVEAAQSLTCAEPVAVAGLPITWQCWGGKQTSCTHVVWKKQGPLHTHGKVSGYVASTSQRIAPTHSPDAKQADPRKSRSLEAHGSATAVGSRRPMPHEVSRTSGRGQMRGGPCRAQNVQGRAPGRASSLTR